ncbi:thioredoxin family protein [Dokdonia sp. Hel_I_53]|uniref:thioredoxin family protein n=1 Tax=Dokdonia sp. Hel_I_53 TaxID=1566287 RepID=UPI001198F9E9|nr:thioredoxin family protein [Dokdonia sp. Hel_I_53]TVZ52766.1 thiol-disulfide isomerase/thioredoxin [Dokdonia sp. Hel_I_53]
MKVIEDTKEQLVENALKDAISYKDYRAFTEQHAIVGTNSGDERSENLANYTMLNHKRMKRLDKTLKLSEDVKTVITNYDNKVTWLVLTETWCGDAAQTMPVMQKFADLNEGIQFKVVLRDEHKELMDAFLYNGGRSIPKLIAYDSQGKKIVGDWGPRPTKATKLVNDYKEEHGSLTPEFKQDLQIWYTKDKGQNTAEDLLKLLQQISLEK